MQIQSEGINILQDKTMNIVSTNVVEKGIAALAIEYLVFSTNFIWRRVAQT